MQRRLIHPDAFVNVFFPDGQIPLPFGEVAPESKRSRPRHGWIVLDPQICRSIEHHRLGLKGQIAYMQNLIACAVYGIPVPLDPHTGCGVVVSRRHVWSKEDRADVIARCGGACVSCRSADNLVLDHVVPLARGGPDTKANLQALCKRCNSRKWAHMEVPA